MFSRPFGTKDVRGVCPNVETLGYCRMSLRDRTLAAVVVRIWPPPPSEALRSASRTTTGYRRPTLRVGRAQLEAAAKDWNGPLAPALSPSEGERGKRLERGCRT